MPILSVKVIENEDFRQRLSGARLAYLDNRNDESVSLSVAVYLDLIRDNPDALAGTRLDRANRFGQWPDYGVTLTNQGSVLVDAVSDGRAHTAASAICYFEFVLEAVILAQGTPQAAAKAAALNSTEKESS